MYVLSKHGISRGRMALTQVLGHVHLFCMKHQEGMKQQHNHCTVLTVNCFTDNKGKPTILTSGLTEEHGVHCKLKEDLCLLVSSLLSPLWHDSLQGQ